MVVQLARDLGEDFYGKFWSRTVALLSKLVNHSDFSVIEVLSLRSWLTTVDIQHPFLALEVLGSTARLKSILHLQ
jgi:hypothetical protein